MEMEVSGESKKLVDRINSYSKKPIKNNFEISIIIESALKSNKKNAFDDLIFKAKYIKGLKSIMSNRIVVGNDFMEKMFDEFNKTLQLFSTKLKDVISASDETAQKHFNDKYFELNQESIKNSMELIDDLAICKEFFNNNSGISSN